MMRIAGREIGPGRPCFVIAEAGVNHNGDLDLAHKLIDAAAEAGADAVKFQTFSADATAAPDAALAEYQARREDAPASQHALLAGLELPRESYAELKAYAESRNLVFLSTPFDEPSLALLEPLNLAAYKLPSGEIVNLRFLDAVARTGRPIILSTGMARLGEIDRALSVLRSAGCHDIALLHCVSCYPAPAEACNLSALPLLARTFGVPVGFSDHTLGTAVALAAVALGACILEKHFTLDRNLPGPDHAASLEPGELVSLVHDIRTVESALGLPVKAPQECELEISARVRKSLRARVPITAGEALAADMLDARRGAGLPVSSLEALLGRKVSRNLSPGEPLLEIDLI